MYHCSRTVSLVLLGILLAGAVQAQVPTLVREFEEYGQTVTVDNTKARFEIEVIDEFEDQPEQAQLARGLFKNFTDAHEAVQSAHGTLLPSVSLIYGKCKRFDDGVYAAVELAVEDGIGKLGLGKRELLWQLLTVVDAAQLKTNFGKQAAHLATSRIWGAFKNADIPVGAKPSRVVDSPAEDLSRKPISFYTWNLQLERIFRRDTALQHRYDMDEPAEVAAAALIAWVIETTPHLKREYEALNALYSRLTNKLTWARLSDMVAAAGSAAELEAAANDKAKAMALAENLGTAGRKRFAVLPPSQAKENEAALVGGMNEFIACVRDGTIDLKPEDDSGWYEYQQFALEPLLLTDTMPEGDKLELGEKYKRLLESQFKSVISQVRETHAKQLEMTMGMIPVSVTPHLAVEPIPTTYLRFAEAYDFLRTQLRERIGPEALQLHARDEGAVERQEPIDSELTDLQKLLIGAQLFSCRDIGLSPWPEEEWQTRDPGEAMEFAEEWLASWQDDPDMARDVRMMVPVSIGPNRFWCVVGVGLTKVKVSYVDPPAVTGATADFDDAEYWIPTERFVEVMGLKEPLNRDEFRALCDEHKSVEGILEALKGEGGMITPIEDLEGNAPLPLPTGPAVILVALIGLLVIGLVVWRLGRGALGK